MNDYCKQLFEHDSVNISECAADEEEVQQGEADDADNAYSWYTYDMEDADELEQACAKVVSFNGKYTNYYDSATSGSVHTRKRGSLVTNASTGLSGGAITAIVLVCAAVAGAAVRILKDKKEKASALQEPMYQGGQMS